MSDGNDEANTNSQRPQGKTAEKYKYPDLATETAFEYKYQIAMETAERNTSKQFSAKETVLRNVYKYSRINFILFYFILFFFEAE